jgi:hypothetical protein
MTLHDKWPLLSQIGGRESPPTRSLIHHQSSILHLIIDTVSARTKGPCQHLCVKDTMQAQRCRASTLTQLGYVHHSHRTYDRLTFGNGTLCSVVLVFNAIRFA